MEIRRLLRGETMGFSAARPPQSGMKEKAGARPSADRLELSRQWVQTMEEQRVQAQSALTSAKTQDEEDEGGILGYMETEEGQLDELSDALDIQMKCLKIAMNMMKGRKVPPEDERYLMEHDPEGYKVAIAMKALVKEDKKECESVLKDEDKNGEETAETEEAAPAETAPDSGGDME